MVRARARIRVMGKVTVAVTGPVAGTVIVTVTVAGDQVH